MPVHFYLAQAGTDDPVAGVCWLSQRAIRKSRPLWIYCIDAAELSRLDQLLWTAEPASFIPHGVDEPAQPVCLSCSLPAADYTGAIINLTAAVLHDQLQPVLEMVGASEQAREAGRQRFRQYQQLGVTPAIVHCPGAG